MIHHFYKLTPLEESTKEKILKSGYDRKVGLKTVNKFFSIKDTQTDIRFVV